MKKLFSLLLVLFGWLLLAATSVWIGAVLYYITYEEVEFSLVVTVFIFSAITPFLAVRLIQFGHSLNKIFLILLLFIVSSCASMNTRAYNYSLPNECAKLKAQEEKVWINPF